MQTFEIQKYKSVIENYTPPHQHQNYQNRYYPSQIPNLTMDKLTYANFINNLSFDVGDWIVYESVTPPYNKWQVYLVRDIIEIHHHVKNWGSQDSGPWCVYASGWVNEQSLHRAPDGTEVPRLIAPKRYKKIDPKDVPEEVLKLYAHLGNK